MPVTVIVGLLALVLALVFYSIGVWTAFRRKGFGPLQIWMLWLGVLFDIAATVSMGWRIGGLDFSPAGRVHTILALIAFLGMLTVTIVGEVSYVKKNAALGAKWSRYAIIPWVYWVIIFLWGMATKR